MAEVGKDITEYLKEFHTTEGKAIKARELWAKDIYSSAYSREVIARAQELTQELTQE